MKTEILSYALIGLVVSGAWVGIIWALGEYTPSPWWGILCLPVLLSVPFLKWVSSTWASDTKELERLTLPKESRLLTDEEFIALFTEDQRRRGVLDKYNFPEAIEGNKYYHRILAQAQDTKTEEIVRNQWRQKCEDLVAARHQITKEESVKARDKEWVEWIERYCSKLGGI